MPLREDEIAEVVAIVKAEIAKAIPKEPEKAAAVVNAKAVTRKDDKK